MQISWRQGQSWARIFWGRKREERNARDAQCFTASLWRGKQKALRYCCCKCLWSWGISTEHRPQNPTTWPYFPCGSYIYRLVFVTKQSVHAGTYFVLYMNCKGTFTWTVIFDYCMCLFVIVLLTILLSIHLYVLRSIKADGFVRGPAPDEMERGWGARARLQSQS